MRLVLGVAFAAFGLAAAAILVVFVRAMIRDKRQERAEDQAAAWHATELRRMREELHHDNQQPTWDQIVAHQLPLVDSPAGGDAPPPAPANGGGPGPADAPTDSTTGRPRAGAVLAAGPGALVTHPDPSLWVGHAETYPATPQHMAAVIAAEATLDYPHPIGWYTDLDADKAGAA